MMWTLTALLAMVLLHSGLAADNLNVRYQWTTPDFVFPSDAVRQAMINNGSYIPGNPFMLDVDVWREESEEKVFVTTPRVQAGTPATLYTLSQNTTSNTTSPLLEPYPSWAWNLQGDCNALQSVFRTMVDPCGRLWVVDSGAVDILTGTRYICQPKIVVFDVSTNRLISRYLIPRENLLNDSLLITIATDVRHENGNCQDTFAYIADVHGHALIVLDANNNRSWRVNGNLFGPDAGAENFTVAGDSFSLTDGVFGLALGPVVNGDRTLYFHSLASFRECWVQTSVLRNETLFLNGTNAAATLFHESLSERSSQSGATAMDHDGVLFFNLLSNSTLNCWNSSLPYSSENLVELVKDEELLQFVSGMKMVQDRRGRETVWALSGCFQKLVTGSFNASEVNYRVVTASVADLVNGTSCESTSNALQFGHVHANNGRRYLVS